MNGVNGIVVMDGWTDGCLLCRLELKLSPNAYSLGGDEKTFECLN